MKYDRSSLEKVGIFELRLYAKKCGVYSPTTKRKKEIIDEIINIQEGDSSPVFNNRGRRNIDFQLFDREESLYDFYKNNLSDFSEIDINLNIKTANDFMIYFDELVKNSFNAKVIQLGYDKYKIDFLDDIVSVEIREDA